MATKEYREPERSTKQGFAFGVAIIASALLFIAGFAAIFQGISAIANDNLLSSDRSMSTSST